LLPTGAGHPVLRVRRGRRHGLGGGGGGGRGGLRRDPEVLRQPLGGPLRRLRPVLHRDRGPRRRALGPGGPGRRRPPSLAAHRGQPTGAAGDKPAGGDRRTRRGRGRHRRGRRRTGGRRSRGVTRREIFSPAAKQRAARFMAERGTAVRRPNGGNGHGRTLVLDPAKLARFEPARERVAGQLTDGTLPARRRPVERREILQVSDLTIHFGGVHALEGVDLVARTAEIAGVIGPNGAGKTTFFNCLSGLLTPDRGNIVFDGHKLDGSPASRGRVGLGRTFQTPRLFGSLSVLQNLSFGCRTADFSRREYVFDPALRRLSHQERGARIARMVGYRGDLAAPAGSLPFG